jgi:hypothetical protein
MKITIEIPEWAKERHIFIMAGTECLAVKYASEKEVYVKTERCRFYDFEKCGMCCDGCEFQMPDGGCGLEDRPWKCCIDDPKNILENTPECKLRYEIK